MSPRIPASMQYGRVLRSGFLALGLLLFLTSQASLPRKEVWIARGTSQQEIARFTVEIAETPETQTRGLMERPALASNAGMLFIDADHRIINIQANAVPCVPPQRCPTYNSTAPAKYVLEIAGGRAQALGSRAGDYVH